MTHFPIKVTKLQTKVVLIKPEYKEKKDLQRAVREKSPASSAKENTQKNGGGNVLGAKCTLDDLIPHRPWEEILARSNASCARIA